MQAMKRVTKLRVTKAACQTMLATEGLKDALANQRALFPTLCTPDELCPPARCIVDCGPSYDVEAENQLLGRGLRPGANAMVSLRPMAESLLARVGIEGWDVAKLDTVWHTGSVFVHAYASTQGSNIVHSTLYTRSRTRDASHALICWTPPATARRRSPEEEWRVVQVKQFCRVLDTDGVVAPLRFAVVDIFDEPPASKPTLDDPKGDLGVIWRARKGMYSKTNVALALEEIYFSLAKAERSNGDLYFFQSLVTSDARRM